MGLSLTCACSARFELEDTLAGQEVSCPECQQLLRVPSLPSLPSRTSVYALASAILALVGMFTVLGTVAAVVVGGIALLSISRSQGRVTGTGFALFGMVFGALFTAFTVYALTTSDLFGLDGWLRSSTVAEELDYSGPLEVVHPGFTLSRPSEKWGVVPDNQSDDPLVSSLQRNLDLLLMNVPRHAYIDVRVLTVAPGRSLTQCQDEVIKELEARPANPFADDDDDEPFGGQPRRAGQVQVVSRRVLPNDGDTRIQEVVAIARCGPKTWQFLVRLYQRGQGPIYVVRGYAPRNRLSRVEHELQAALASFTIRSN